MAKFIKLPNNEVVNLELVFKLVLHTDVVRLISIGEISSSVKLNTKEEALDYFNYLEKILTY